MNRFLPLAAVVVLSFIRPQVPARPSAQLVRDRSIASLIPERCRVYVEGPELPRMLREGHAHPFFVTLASTSLGRALRTEGRGLEALVARADAWLGQPLLPLLADLTECGVAVGFDPASESIALVAIARDENAAGRSLAALLAAIERQLDLGGALRRPHSRQDEADLWFLGEGVVARRGELVVVGNERELVAEVLALAGDPRGRGLLDRSGFEDQRELRPAGATLWAWLQMEELEPLGDEGLQKLRKAGTAPAAQGLFGAALSALCGGRAICSELFLDGEGVELRARAVDAPYVHALSPGAREGEVPAEPTGASLGTALLYRDYARFLSERSGLFPGEAQSAFAEAITTGALFFGGRDLGTEVLPHLSPWIRLVSRVIEFPAGRRPEIPLPGLAAIAVLDEPLEGEAWTAALQSLTALLGVERAQQGEEGLRLRLASEGGVEITSACFPTPRTGEGIDLKYNLEPAVAVVGRHLIVGTHMELVRELVQELAAAEPGVAGGEPEQLQFDLWGLAALVAENSDVLSAQKMLSDGLDPAAAAREIERLRLAVASLARIGLEVKAAAAGTPEARLTLLLRTNDER